MEFNIGAMKAEAMRKAFGIDIEKGRTGVYEDNAENRRLNRVGQSYGHKKEEEAPKGRQAVKQEEPAGDKKGAAVEATPVAKHAEGASDEALKRAVADPKAAPEVKAAAEAEMKKRGSGGEEEVEVKEEVQIDEKAYNKAKKRLSEIEKEIKKYEPYLDKEGYGFVKKNIRELEKERDSIHKEIGVEGVKRLTAEKAKKAKNDYVKHVKEYGGSKFLDDFLDKNSEHFKSVLEEYGAEKFTDLQDILEEKFADDAKDPYGYEHMDKLYFKCLHMIPDEKYLSASPYKWYNE